MVKSFENTESYRGIGCIAGALLASYTQAGVLDSRNTYVRFPARAAHADQAMKNLTNERVENK